MWFGHLRSKSGRITMNDEEKIPACCPTFGVESGVPIIGLGIIIILFGIIPILYQPARIIPVPVSATFIGFGIFLIWAGLTK
jgi:hypothetical protein